MNKGNQKMGKKMRKGSFTIEALCVMSLILLVLFGVLYLSFYVHNRAWLTAAACEAALAGSMDGTLKDGDAYETSDMRARELGSTGFFGAENLKARVSAKKEVKVTYSAETIAGYGGFHWYLTVEGKSKIIRPVKWIRKIKAAKELVTEK